MNLTKKKTANKTKTTKKIQKENIKRTHNKQTRKQIKIAKFGEVVGYANVLLSD